MPSSAIYQIFYVRPAPYAHKPKNEAAKTPRAEFENRSQVTSVALYFVRLRVSPYKSPREILRDISINIGAVPAAKSRYFGGLMCITSKLTRTLL